MLSAPALRHARSRRDASDQRAAPAVPTRVFEQRIERKGGHIRATVPRAPQWQVLTQRRRMPAAHARLRQRAIESACPICWRFQRLVERCQPSFDLAGLNDRALAGAKPRRQLLVQISRIGEQPQDSRCINWVATAI